MHGAMHLLVTMCHPYHPSGLYVHSLHVIIILVDGGTCVCRCNCQQFSMLYSSPVCLHLFTSVTAILFFCVRVSRAAIGSIKKLMTFGPGLASDVLG